MYWVGDTESIIVPQNRYYENTYFLSALLYLLTGRDFSETDAKTKKEIHQAQKKAITEYANGKIQEPAKRRELLSKQLELFDGIDVEQKIAELVQSLKTAEEGISSALNESKTLLSTIMETEEREAECDVLLSRFKQLKGQYSADIKRLSFIADGETEFSNVPKPANCPFCDGEIAPRGRKSYINVSKSELKRIAAQLEGLISSEQDVLAEKSEIEEKLKELRQKRDNIEALIKEELQPKASQLSESIASYKAYIQISNEIKLVSSFAQDFAFDINTYSTDEDENEIEYHPREYFDDDFQSVMTEYAMQILRECNYENLTSARFDMSIFDIEVNGESKENSNGKGYRAYLN